MSLKMAHQTVYLITISTTQNGS